MKIVSLVAEVLYPLRLTATTMMIRVSTLYAGIEMSETDRKLFYKHMGHNSAISQNVCHVLEQQPIF